MVYILEDDDNIRKLIKYSLTSQGFDVQDFSLPSDFWKELEKNKPDLILLDIMLPEEDGISILKKLRFNHETSAVPVIMLTAKDSEYDVVTGLDAGADDYVTKPFGMMALVSRIKAVLRRYEKSDLKKEILEADGIKLDENQHTVFADSQQIFLTVKEFDLLLLLMKNRGNVLTRELLLESVWDLSSDIESRTVDVHIRTLRAKLGKYEKTIETIRGVGYKFV
ncbi:response regulator transcription factor [Treponema sp.]|uniref:response regulator transcription factor n=1 Tax=Treponema sp. TaxID=166 RepID=UPI001D88AD0D|nr:response regulator transcription factor [Treponema sp.]MBS7240825.1 response regulator transcription factor [Treponema sp.]MCI6442445.1 response regulator transcription factor [Spirochaetia bacterium]MDY4132824.1 response regulator transcription factor [Treponema sp.]